ncbi:hypothetical protein [Entomospira culicis]|uniref:Uncharacterized protein n=2 Tax=Entomospira culicis TaxID=2719989 RepID=A0A968KVC9_9SPIO|nr:hypothetical protein [Entomospira culicis]NIZ19811.1 hypothetical protein [Entomospira culicis]NIZ70025.1 hypothetical protein [Entomospira culicis]
MPALLITQLFMGRAPRMVLWHGAIGLLLVLPMVLIRAFLLDQGFAGDYMTFASQWVVVFVLDYLIPFGYLLVMIPWALHCRWVLRDEIYLIAFLATFFAVDGLIFWFFRSSADGAYEYLFRPLFYLLFTLLVARFYAKGAWVALIGLVVATLVAGASDVFIFMNQYLFTALSVLLVVAIAFASWLLPLSLTKRGEDGQE